MKNYSRNLCRAGVVTMLLFGLCSAKPPVIDLSPRPDGERAAQIAEMQFGMFICWSISTFSGKEWTGEELPVDFFRATQVDTDQWARTAKESGMRYIYLLTKHHDGFCLWDTQTTDFKVTNSPLGKDVLGLLRKSCDKYGIKMGLYFSEGDWTWPGAVRGQGGAGGIHPEAKKAQLKELLTQYGPIEIIWFDAAVGDGGLSHHETVEFVHSFQPNTFCGFNAGEPAGRLCLRERGKAGRLGADGVTWVEHAGEHEKNYQGYRVAEFTYPILPAHEGGADWFYSLPKHDSLAYPASKIYNDYLEAVKYGNIFSLDIGPDYAGRIRDVDVTTLREVGRLIQARRE